MKRLLFILLAVVLIPSALYMGVLLLVFLLALYHGNPQDTADPLPVPAVTEFRHQTMIMRPTDRATGLPLVFQRSDWPALELEPIGHLTRFRDLVEKGSATWIRTGTRVEILESEKDDPAVKIEVNDGPRGWVLWADLVDDRS